VVLTLKTTIHYFPAITVRNAVNIIYYLIFDQAQALIADLKKNVSKRGV
jgi:uncharacterized protein (UPF0332 family)